MRYSKRFDIVLSINKKRGARLPSKGPEMVYLQLIRATAVSSVSTVGIVETLQLAQAKLKNFDLLGCFNLFFERTLAYALIVKIESFQKDPFRLFFPLGALFALFGLVPWLSLLTESAAYPAQFHRMVMMNGFLLAFVCGFLMTAIPRFTKTDYASSREVLLAFFLLAFAVGFSFLSNPAWHYLLAASVQLSLAAFAFKRFRRRKSDPPVSFSFVGLGLVMWLLSNFYFFLSSLGIINQSFNWIFQPIFSHGAILSLILGIGSRLLPALMGWQEVLPASASDPRQKKFFLGMTAAFLLTYFLVLPAQLHLIIRTGIVLFIAIRYWKLLRFPKARNYFNWNLWLCGWCLLLAVGFLWVEDGRAVHFLHLLLVGGFAWLTLLISLHVKWAHQENPNFQMKSSKLFLLFAVLVFMAMLTRVTAVFWPHIYLRHLAYAAITLLLAIAMWAWLFFRPLVEAGRTKKL